MMEPIISTIHVAAFRGASIMTSVPPAKPSPASARDATDLGFVQGETMRKTGSKPEHLDFNLDMEIGDVATSAFADDWKAGFRAGYLGSPKPK
jgi:hypothetical protein